MKAVSVELVPRDASIVTLGVVSAMSVRSAAPSFSSCSPEKAVIAIGTLIRLSARRRAVTVMTSPFSSVAAACSSALAPVGAGAGAGGVGWAKAGAVKAASATAALDSFRPAIRLVLLAMDILLMIRLAGRRGRATGGPQNLAGYG